MDDNINRELMKRWIPYMQLAEEMGISLEEVEAIVWSIMKARSGGNGLCYIPVPANPTHAQLLRHLVGEVLEACGFPVMITELRIPKE